MTLMSVYNKKSVIPCEQAETYKLVIFMISVHMSVYGQRHLQFLKWVQSAASGESGRRRRGDEANAIPPHEDIRP